MFSFDFMSAAVVYSTSFCVWLIGFLAHSCYAKCYTEYLVMCWRTAQ